MDCVCGACGALLRLTKGNGNDDHSCGWKCRGASHVGGAPRCSPFDALWKSVSTSDLVSSCLPQCKAHCRAAGLPCRSRMSLAEKRWKLLHLCCLARSLSALSDRGHQYHNLGTCGCMVYITVPFTKASDGHSAPPFMRAMRGLTVVVGDVSPLIFESCGCCFPIYYVALRSMSGLVAAFCDSQTS